MKRKLRVPDSFVKKLGRLLGPDRELKNTVLTKIQDGVPDADRTDRDERDNRFFVHQIPIRRDQERHLFLVIVDDTTSPDDLILEDIVHVFVDADD